MKRLQSELVEPRVTLSAGVESFRLMSGGASPSVELRVSYDLGQARSALTDLDYAYGRVRGYLEQAMSGEYRERSERVETAAADRHVMKGNG